MAASRVLRFNFNFNTRETSKLLGLATPLPLTQSCPHQDQGDLQHALDVPNGSRRDYSIAFQSGRHDPVFIVVFVRLATPPTGIIVIYQWVGAASKVVFVRLVVPSTLITTCMFILSSSLFFSRLASHQYFHNVNMGLLPALPLLTPFTLASRYPPLSSSSSLCVYGAAASAVPADALLFCRACAPVIII